MKINFQSIVDSFQNNKGTALACIASGCVVVTAILSARAAVRIQKVMDANPNMDNKQKAKTFVKEGWPAAVATGLTIAGIMGSDRAHVGKEIAIAGVATMWREKFLSLDKKAAEKIEEKEMDLIHRELKMEDRKRAQDLTNEVVYRKAAPGSLLLVYEPYTDQYFYTSRERIAWTMLAANRELMDKYDVRLNFIIKKLGGTAYPEGDRIGWSMENSIQDYSWSYIGGPWIELIPDITKTKDGKEALCLFYQVDPETMEYEDKVYSN